MDAKKKKVYQSPKLDELGAVTDLTAGTFSTMMDNDGTMTLAAKK